MTDRRYEIWTVGDVRTGCQERYATQVFSGDRCYSKGYNELFKLYWNLKEQGYNVREIRKTVYTYTVSLELDNGRSIQWQGWPY